MVTKFGMSEAVGLINYDDDNNEVFIGRDLAHTARGYGEGVATVIDQEVKELLMNVMTEQDISLENMMMFCMHAQIFCWKKKRFPGKNLKRCSRKMYQKTRRKRAPFREQKMREVLVI